MLTHHTAQILMTAAIVGSWLAATVVFRRTAVDSSLSISTHSAQTQASLVIFMLTMAINAITFTWVAIWWLMPVLKLSYMFAVAVAIATTCQLAAGLIPERPGRLHLAHGIVAYTMSVMMPVILSFIVLSPNAPIVLRTIAALVVEFMLISFGLFLTIPAIRRHYLWYQSAYILSFQIVVLFALFAIRKS